jgi:hypothetical protein
MKKKKKGATNEVQKWTKFRKCYKEVVEVMKRRRGKEYI